MCVSVCLYLCAFVSLSVCVLVRVASSVPAGMTVTNGGERKPHQAQGIVGSPWGQGHCELGFTAVVMTCGPDWQLSPAHKHPVKLCLCFIAYTLLPQPQYHSPSF